GRLSAPAGPDQQRHRPIADFQVYAPQRQHFSAAVSELLTHALAVNCDFWTHLFYPRKTCAGSKTRTRRTLIRLAKITTNKMATPVPTTFCKIKTSPRVGRFLRVIAKKVAHSPEPMEKPIAPTVRACRTIIPIIRQLVTPIAFSAPNCFRFSIVNM